MKTEFLEKLGLEQGVIEKIQSESIKDIEREKGKATTVQEKLTEVEGQLETAKTTLKSFEGVDVEDLQGKIATLTTDLATKETDYQSKIAQMELQGKVDSHLSGKTFVNDFTKNSIKDKMLKMLESEDSKGKSYDDLLDSLTKDEKGEPIQNIFTEQGQQNESGVKLNSGQNHGSTGDNAPKTLQEALKEKFQTK